MESYMYDKEFLKQLDYNREKEIYVRIISLDNNDIPKEEILGKVTSGSVNVDGASAVRRTCSLSLVANKEDTIITNAYWCYNTKFKLEIGLKNNIDSKYPDIIWFKMGIYIITSFNYNETTNNLTISISGQDKMCRLNGTVSGNIAMTTDFGTIDETTKIEETGEYLTTTNKLPIYEIIRNAIKEYGQELDYNIIINDLDKYGYELMEYRGDSPMYMIIKKDTNAANNAGEVLNIIFDGTSFGLDDLEEIEISKLNFYDFDKNNKDTASIIEHNSEKCYVTTRHGEKFTLCDIENLEVVDTINDKEEKVKVVDRKLNRIEKYYSFNTLDKNYNDDATEITYGGISCYVAKIEFGDTAGYHRTPLIYNTDLVLNAGDTVTSLLDKLKAMLGDYEYFYNLDGRFIFLKKKTYIQELFSPINGDIITPTMYASQYSYKFEDDLLFTAISNNPNISNLKNDFSVWGVKGGTDLPIHARYGINKKPLEYICYQQFKILPENYFIYEDILDPLNLYSEIIDINPEYQEKIKGYCILPNYHEQLKITGISNNIFKDNKSLLGIQLPQNLLSCWSETFNNCSNLNTIIIPTSLTEINPHLFDTCAVTQIYYEGTELEWNNCNLNQSTILKKAKIFYEMEDTPIRKYTIQDYDWRELIYQMAIDFYAHNQESDYLLKLQEYNSWAKNGKTEYEQYYSDLEAFWRLLYNPLETLKDIDYAEIYEYEYYIDGDNKYWNKNIHIDPTNFTFWFDFLDTNGELGKYGIDKIGSRSKVVNDNAIKSIYYKEIPEILFYYPTKEDLSDLPPNSFSKMQLLESMDVLFTRSAQGNSAIAKMNELIYQNIAITQSISITSIPIYYLLPNTRIYVAGLGDYTLDKISYSLNYNGTMSINGNKIMKQFY